jgi:hypothetical protein
MQINRHQDRWTCFSTFSSFPRKPTFQLCKSQLLFQLLAFGWQKLDKSSNKHAIRGRCQQKWNWNLGGRDGTAHREKAEVCLGQYDRHTIFQRLLQGLHSSHLNVLLHLTPISLHLLHLYTGLTKNTPHWLSTLESMPAYLCFCQAGEHWGLKMAPWGIYVFILAKAYFHYTAVRHYYDLWALGRSGI